MAFGGALDGVFEGERSGLFDGDVAGSVGELAVPLGDEVSVGAGTVIGTDAAGSPSPEPAIANAPIESPIATTIPKTVHSTTRDGPFIGATVPGGRLTGG